MLPITLANFASQSSATTQGFDSYEVYVGYDDLDKFDTLPTVGNDGTLSYKLAAGATAKVPVYVTAVNTEGKSQANLLVLSYFMEIDSEENAHINGVPIDPHRFETLGVFENPGGNPMIFNTDSGMVTGPTTAQSRSIYIDTDGRPWRVFAFQTFDSSVTAPLVAVGGKGFALVSTSNLNIDGEVAFNGANGENGENYEGENLNGASGSSGGNGGKIFLAAERELNLSGKVTAYGGNGGNGGNGYVDPQNPFSGGIGGSGGNGGHGGEIYLAADTFNIAASIETVGGNGGSNGSGGAFTNGFAGSGGNGGKIVVADTGETLGSYDVSGGTKGSGNTSFITQDGLDGSLSYVENPLFIGPRIYFVDQAASGNVIQDGFAFSTAYASLQDALSFAVSGDEVWVAKGIYYPDEAEKGYASVTADDPADSFLLQGGVKLYGGFAGDENTFADRVPDGNTTVLSGDIQQDDADRDSAGISPSYSSLSGTNAYHVVTVTGDETATLDNMTVTAGKGVGNLGEDEKHGAGIWVNGYGITVTDCRLHANAAYSRGGGVYGSSVITMVSLNSTLIENNSANQGGGFNFGLGNVTITDVICRSNLGNGGGGGGMMHGGGANSRITRCKFVNNLGNRISGALAVLGGQMPVENSLFSGNKCYDTTAGRGAGLYLSGNHRLTHLTISGNYAGQLGGGVYVEAGSPVIESCIISNNRDGSGSAVEDQNIYVLGGTPSAYASLIESAMPTDLADDGLNVHGDPAFMDPQDPASAPTASGNYLIMGQSPAVNAGSPAPDPMGSLMDLRNNIRSIGPAEDMGAYEYDGPMTTNTPVTDIQVDLNTGGMYNFDHSIYVSGFDGVSESFSDGSVFAYTNDPAMLMLNANNLPGQSSLITLTYSMTGKEDIMKLTFNAEVVNSNNWLATFRGRYGMNYNGSDDWADWSGNGVQNILYYAFNLGDPNQVGAIPQINFNEGVMIGLPSLEILETEVVYSYVRRMNDPYAGYSILTGDDLSTWLDIASPDEGYKPHVEEPIAIDGDYELRRLRFLKRDLPSFFKIEFQELP